MTLPFLKFSQLGICGPESGGVSDSGLPAGGGSGPGAAVEAPDTQPFEDNNPFSESDLPPAPVEPRGGHRPGAAPVKPVEPAAKPAAEPAAPAAPAAPATPRALTPEEIAQISAETAARYHAQTAPAQQQQPEPALTDDEYNRLFNVPVVTQKLYEDIFGMTPDKPERIAALHAYGQGVARQAVTMANFIVQREMKAARQQLEARLSPLLTQHSRSVEDNAYNEFFTANPDLKDYRELAEHVVKINEPTLRRYNADKNKIYSHVAGELRRLLGKPAVSAQPNDPSRVTQTQPQPQASQRRMTATLGSGPAAGGGTATPTNPYTADATALFGDLRG